MQEIDHIAHLKYESNTQDWVLQSNREHLNGVAFLASKFAGEFKMSDWGKVLGL